MANTLRIDATKSYLTTNLRLRSDLKEYLRVIAFDNHASANSFVNSMLEEMQSNKALATKITKRVNAISNK